MEVKDLEPKVQGFVEALEQITKRREAWTSQVKAFILATFEEVKNEFRLDWNAYALEPTTNSEGVTLTFGSSPSGIFEKTEKGITNFIKKGGALILSQAYNGQILVIYSYPEVKGIIENHVKTKLVKRIDPRNIDKDFMIQQISDFLEEMTEWEITKSSPQIGFKQ